LVQAARGFHSTVMLKCGGKVADLRSLLSILALCATLGASLEIEVEGDDEQNAVEVVERIFKHDADTTDTTDLG
jgi:phosphocarrier protein HPr